MLGRTYQGVGHLREHKMRGLDSFPERLGTVDIVKVVVVVVNVIAIVVIVVVLVTVIYVIVINILSFC